MGVQEHRVEGLRGLQDVMFRETGQEVYRLRVGRGMIVVPMET